MDEQRTADSTTALKVIGWLCAVLGVLGMLANYGDNGGLELISRLLVGAGFVCGLIVISRRGQ